MDKNFGILTLATPSDYKKAIGLALSAKISNPGVPLAVACAPKLRHLLEPYFDYVIDENSSLRGFEHKVHLDRYSPFKDTFFFDSDVLLFRPLNEVVAKWADQSYTAVGVYRTDGFSCFGLDRKKVLQKINKTNLVVIDGAGHAFFRKPQCDVVFNLAREVTEKHREYVGDIKYADEDVIDIVMTVLGLPPAKNEDFFSRYVSAVPGTLKMDATVGQCRYTAQASGLVSTPVMMHFAANEAPFAYVKQLHKLFKKNNVPTKGLYAEAIKDFYHLNIEWPVKDAVKRAIGWRQFK